MKKGYLAKEAARMRAGRARGLVLLWSIALVSGIMLFHLARYMPALIDMLSLIIAAGFLVVFIPTLFFIVNALREWMRPQPYGNLVVYAEGAEPEEAGRIIDAEATQNNILVDEYIHTLTGKKVKFTKRKIVLLPSYLLISLDNGAIAAIPADKIYWICIQVSYRCGTPIGKLKVFYDRKIQELDGVEFLHTYQTLKKLQQHIPDVFYTYNPFLFAAELEKLFHRDYNNFMKLYNQHKEMLQAQAEEQST